MTSGFLWAAAANAGLTLAAVRLAASCTAPPSRLLATLLFRILLVSLSVLAFGILGALRPEPLGIFWTLAGTALCLRRRPRLPSLGILRELDPAALALTAAAALLLLAQAWILVPVVPDALSYHLPKVGLWIQSGGFTSEWGPDHRSTFPSGFELVEAWWVLFPRHDVLIELAGAEFWMLGIASGWTLARALGLGARASSLAAAGAALCPGLLLQAGSCLNDGAAASLVVASFALAVRGAPWSLLATAAGMGIGVKPTFAYALPGLLGMAWASRRQERETFAGGRLRAAVAAAGLLLGSSWYVRNWVQYGNPIHPMESKGILVRGHQAQQLGPSVQSLWLNFRRLADYRIYDREPYGPMMELIAAWGAAGLCAIPAWIAAARRDAKFLRLALAAVLSTASVFLLAAPDAWSMRFVLWLAPLLALPLARQTELTPSLRWLFLSCLVLQGLGSIVPASLPENAITELQDMSWETRSLSPYRSRTLPRDRIGCLAASGLQAYGLFGPGFERHLIVLRPRDSADLELDLQRRHLEAFIAPPDTEIVRTLVSGGGWRRDVGNLYLRSSR